MKTLETLAAIWRDAGLPEAALDQVSLPTSPPIYPSAHAVGPAAQSSIAAMALAVAEILYLRDGQRAAVSVDRRHALAEFRSEHLLRLDGVASASLWDEIAGPYPCGDGRWIRIHTNFPHHRDGILKLLGCAYSREAVAAALQGWTAEVFEEAAAEAGMIAAMMRSPEEWRTHPQGRLLDTLPLVAIEKIGEAPPRPLPAGGRPLSGLRVLDLTRIIAGPVCGRALAAHGAEVLRVSAPHLPSIESLDIDTGRGKRSAHIDLRGENGRRDLRRLLEEADVMVQGYRPGAVAGFGFGPEEAARLRSGIIYVSLSAYGEKGPWSGRRGFDSIAQTAIGINQAEAAAFGLEGPKALPCQSLDHASGYLMAFGALAGLRRRALEGGSWHVQVSLARTGHWLQDLGLSSSALDVAEPAREAFADLLEEYASGFGTFSAIRHAGLIEGHAPRWDQPTMPLGSHPPHWL